MPVVKKFSDLDLDKSYTYADYLMWEFKERVELIKGKIFKMSPAPSRGHQQISFELSRQFGNFFFKQKCEVFSAPFDVRLARKKGDKNTITVVQPDLCVVCDMEKLDDRGCNDAPDLIIEILSPGNSKREMQQKFDLYQESGVKEYWLVHPQDESVFAYVLNEEGIYIGLRPKVKGEIATPAIFPDLKVILDDVFPDKESTK